MNMRTDTRPAHAVPSGPPPPRHRGGRRRRVIAIALTLAVPLILGGFAAWWFVLRTDAPAAVSLDSAVAGLSGGGPASSTSATSAATTSGTWTVDTTIANADGTGTFAGFRVEEELVGIGATTAVGRSGNVTGTLTVVGTEVTAAEFTVDLADITSNDSRRVRAINSALGTSQFPSATFVLTEPFDVGSVPAEGERISASVVGDLTVHGVTRSTTVAIDAQVENGVLVLVGSAPVTFSDFGIATPSAPIVASVDDHGVIEIQLYLTQS